MSIYQDRIDPNNPLYYAPPHTRERQEDDWNTQHDVPITEFANERMPYDAFLEKAVADALRHPLDPVVLDLPPDFEETRFEILLRLTARVSAALAVAACVVAFFAFAVPGSRSLPAAEQWLSAIMQSNATQLAANEAKSSSLTDVSSQAKASRLDDVSPEQAEKLLQQFVEWQRKPIPTTTLGQTK